MSCLVCDKCGGYYELQPSESPEDFDSKCGCGGHLRYVQNLNDDDLQKVCPKCGSLIEDNNDEVCPTCRFGLKKSDVSENGLILGILWDVFSISVLMIFLIIFTYMLGLIVVKVIYNPQLISSIKSDIFTDLWILLTVPVLYICILIGVIARLGIAKEKYQEFYKKNELE